LPFAFGLGGEDKIAPVGAAAHDPTRLLAVAEPEALHVAFDLSERLGVLRRRVVRFERSRLLPLDDEAIVDRVGATGTPHRHFGVRNKFDIRAACDANQVGLDWFAKGPFEHAVPCGVFEDRSKLARLVS